MAVMAQAEASGILLLGGLVIAAVVTKAAAQRLRIPPIVFFLLLGLALSAIGRGRIPDVGEQMLGIFANIGVACLLFRVGLKSNLRGLLEQLDRAAVVWVGDFCISGALGFSTAYFLLGLSLPTSLIIATAMTATSVGVSMATWQAAGAVSSRRGLLLVDVAELDDISGVLAFAVLFAILPALKGGNAEDVSGLLGRTLMTFTLQLAGFATFCIVFSFYIEERLTRWFEKIAPDYGFMILIVGTGFVIAGLASVFGFSIAIGAFFAGLMFSRDPEAVRTDGSFSALYEFFAPFFFFHIGYGVELHVIAPALGIGLVLLLPAILGKLLGNGLPTLFLDGRIGAALIGFSMIPRAEIAMVIAQRGLELGPWAMPPSVFGAMVFISLITCLASPLIVGWLLRRYPQQSVSADVVGPRHDA